MNDDDKRFAALVAAACIIGWVAVLLAAEIARRFA